MPQTLAFLHTSPVHIATFDRLLAEIAPDVVAQHYVDERLLVDARAIGITPIINQRIAQTLQQLSADGAAVIVCTCSTIGACAEQAGCACDSAVVRVDRSMAEQAVDFGGHIVVAATLESTLAPTRQLIHEVAMQRGKAVTISDLLCAGAWAVFERGDHDGYISTIADCLRNIAAHGDVIVLAQASMVNAATHCASLPIPILSSPSLGLATALLAYRRATE